MNITINDLWLKNKKHISVVDTMTPTYLEQKYKEYLKYPEGNFIEYLNKNYPEFNAKVSDGKNAYVIETW